MAGPGSNQELASTSDAFREGAKEWKDPTEPDLGSGKRQTTLTPVPAGLRSASNRDLTVHGQGGARSQAARQPPQSTFLDVRTG